MYDVFSTFTPIVLRTYCISSIISTAILAATSSEPYVALSTVFCLLLIHLIGVLFSRIRIPVTERLVTLSRAWSASTKIVILTSLLLLGCLWEDLHMHLGTSLSRIHLELWYIWIYQNNWDL